MCLCNVKIGWQMKDCFSVVCMWGVNSFFHTSVGKECLQCGRPQFNVGCKQMFGSLENKWVPLDIADPE